MVHYNMTNFMWEFQFLEKKFFFREIEIDMPKMS